MLSTLAELDAELKWYRDQNDVVRHMQYVAKLDVAKARALPLRDESGGCDPKVLEDRRRAEVRYAVAKTEKRLLDERIREVKEQIRLRNYLDDGGTTSLLVGLL